MRARSFFGAMVLTVGCAGSESTPPTAGDSSATDTTGDGVVGDTVAESDDGPADSPADSSGDVVSDGGDSGSCSTSPAGTCSDKALSCLCCPAGGPAVNCTCTTPCNSATDCKDAARPKCNQPSSGGKGLCTANDFKCLWGAVSSRRFKEEIEYVSDKGLERLSSQALSLHLATYRYQGTRPGDRRRLGYILEDAPDAPSSDIAQSQVDLYAYSSMTLATVQLQAKRIDALEREMAALRASCAAAKGK